MSIGGRFAIVAMVVLLGAPAAHAADPTGKWTAEPDTQVDEGTVKGDEIAFTRKVGEFATEQFVAKRAKD